MIVINMIASLVAFVTAIILVVRLFTDGSCVIYKWQFWERETLRIGLIFIALGSFWNFFAKEITPANEVVLNVGIAIIFTGVLTKGFKK